MKKRGFGADRWNGYGGKLELGETIEEAAIREVKEEIGVEATKLIQRGIITFKGEEEADLEVHIFEISEYTGEPTETEEMKPQWFNINEMPYSEMWPDDIYWLPLFIKEKYFQGTFTFKNDEIIGHSLAEVDSLLLHHE